MLDGFFDWKQFIGDLPVGQSACRRFQYAAFALVKLVDQAVIPVGILVLGMQQDAARQGRLL